MALTQNTYSRVHPQRFMMWITIGSLIMMFAGLTSAFIVRRAAGNWVDYKLPDVFWVSTVLILLSSVTLHIAYQMFKQKKWKPYRFWLGSTLFLGVGFVVSQLIGWQHLTDLGVQLTGNPSGSFLYVISGIHAVHVLGGVLFLLIFYAKSFFRKDAVKELMDDINPERTLGIELLLTYWHFVDILWLYLFCFFLFNS